MPNNDNLDKHLKHGNFNNIVKNSYKTKMHF